MKNSIKSIALIFSLILLTSYAVGETIKPKLHLTSPPTRVKVVKNAGGISFRGIPSPGSNYDELKYNLKLSRKEHGYYLKATLLTSPERDDFITAPYLRLITTNGVEFAGVIFTNTMFWSTGNVLSKSIKIDRLPHEYYIACGYAYYYDSFYPHMQGGPQETIVNARNGKIIYRGKPWYKDDYRTESNVESDIAFVGDSLHSRIVKKKCLGDDCTAKINYRIINLKTGSQILSGKNVNEVVLTPKWPGNYLLSMTVADDNYVYWRDIKQLTVLPKIEKTTDPNYLGQIVINDSVGCGLKEDMHTLQDGRVIKFEGEEFVTTKITGSSITNIFGGKGRVIDRDKGFFGYNLGINLTLNMPYLLEIEYAEDQPRTMAFIVGRGNYVPAIHTGYTLGQPEPRYFSEQTMFPISGSRNKLRFMVWAGNNEVRNGFFVGVADPGHKNAPYSAKPLLLKISLYGMNSIAQPKLRTNFPAEFQRYVWSEYENIYPSDQVRFSPHINSLFYGLNALCPAMLSWNGQADANNSIMFRTDLYRKSVRKFVDGIEYETDKMESISNRYNFANEYMDWADQLDLKVFPRFEYAGSDLLKDKYAALQADGQPYPISYRDSTGSSVEDSVDVCYAEVERDFEKVIDDFCSNLSPKNLASLRQPVIRRRGNFMSVSFSEKAMAEFEKATGVALKGESPQSRRSDISGNYLKQYRNWYQKRTFDLLDKIYKRYWENVNQPPSPLLYYHWQNQGMPFEGVYYQNLSDWENTKKIRRLPFEGLPLPTLTEEKVIAAVPEWTSTEEGLSLDSVKSSRMLPIAPIYGKTASSSKKYLDMFKFKNNLAVKITDNMQSKTRLIHHNNRKYAAGLTMYHSMNASMYEAVLAFANGTPNYIMFEQAHAPCFPYPEYARRFFMNYLSLPAVPFEDITVDKDGPVRVLTGVYDKKRYIAIVNTHFSPAVNFKIALPYKEVDTIKPLVGNNDSEAIYVEDEGIYFHYTLDGLELKSFVIKNAK